MCIRDSTCAGMLWHLARACLRRCRTRAEQATRAIAINIVDNFIILLTKGLRHWFGQAKEASTVDLLSCHPAGKRTPPLLVHNLMQKKHPRAQATSWREDGVRVLTDASHFEREASKQYLSRIHQTLGQQRMVEVCMDSTTFAKKELNVMIADAPVLEQLVMLRCPCQATTPEENTLLVSGGNV